jgi:hypothetical protein
LFLFIGTVDVAIALYSSDYLDYSLASIATILSKGLNIRLSCVAKTLMELCDEADLVGAALHDVPDGSGFGVPTILQALTNEDGMNLLSGELAHVLCSADGLDMSSATAARLLYSKPLNFSLRTIAFALHSLPLSSGQVAHALGDGNLPVSETQIRAAICYLGVCETEAVRAQLSAVFVPGICRTALAAVAGRAR